MSERWAAIEIMGHRQHVGKISEETFAGATLVRIEELQRDGTFAVVSYGGSAIFSKREITEQTARCAVMRKDWTACDAFQEASALPPMCGRCGHDLKAHEEQATKALPGHDLDPPNSDHAPVDDDLPI